MYYIDQLIMNLNVNKEFNASIKKCDYFRYRYWQRALLQRVQSVFKINGLPDEWKGPVADFLDYVLIICGFAIVTETPEYGKVFSAGVLSGFDFYYQPTNAGLVNPKMNKQLTIGEDCEIIKFTQDYMGIMDIVNKHAEQLAMLDTAIKVSIKVAKTPYILGGKNKASVEALKAIVRKIDEGDFACFYDQAIADNQATSETEPFQHVELFKSSEYITDRLLDAQSQIINNFDAEVGIPSVPFEKKERLVTAEATSRKLDATARCRTWIDCMNNSFETVNKHYGLNLSAVLTIDELEDADANEEDDNHEQEDFAERTE